MTSPTTDRSPDDLIPVESWRSIEKARDQFLRNPSATRLEAGRVADAYIDAFGGDGDWVVAEWVQALERARAAARKHARSRISVLDRSRRSRRKIGDELRRDAVAPAVSYDQLVVELPGDLGYVARSMQPIVLYELFERAVSVRSATPQLISVA